MKHSKDSAASERGAGDLRILRDLAYTPELAAELGHMCVAWACLEWRLLGLYTIISNTPVAIARAVFYSHHNTTSRIDLVSRTASMVLRGSPKIDAAREKLASLIVSIGRTAKKRNTYIHDPWAAPLADPADVSQLRLGGTDIHGEGKHVTKKDVAQLTDQIVHWIDRVRELDDDLVAQLPALHDTLDRTRFVTLVYPETIRRRENTKQGSRHPPQSSREKK